MDLFSRRYFIGAGIGFGFMTQSANAKAELRFRAPQINLYSKNLPRAVAFYEALGFAETFRTPKKGPLEHIELKLDGFTIGIATFDAARIEHGLHAGGEGRGLKLCSKPMM